MSQENRKPGRPKGQPKTGGRKPGSLNKKNVRVRDQFAMQGFDFAEEFIKCYDKLDHPVLQLQVLLKMAPFFMQRLREDVELPAAPPPNPDDEELGKIPTATLLSQLPQSPPKRSH